MLRRTAGKSAYVSNDYPTSCRLCVQMEEMNILVSLPCQWGCPHSCLSLSHMHVLVNTRTQRMSSQPNPQCAGFTQSRPSCLSRQSRASQVDMHSKFTRNSVHEVRFRLEVPQEVQVVADMLRLPRGSHSVNCYNPEGHRHRHHDHSTPV